MSKSQDNSGAEGCDIVTSDARFMAVWLSVMPVEQLDRQQLFAERERLEQVIAGYDRLLVAAAEDSSGIGASLAYCRAVNCARLQTVVVNINRG